MFDPAWFRRDAVYCRYGEISLHYQINLISGEDTVPHFRAFHGVSSAHDTWRRCVLVCVCVCVWTRTPVERGHAVVTEVCRGNNDVYFYLFVSFLCAGICRRAVKSEAAVARPCA